MNRYHVKVKVEQEWWIEIDANDKQEAQEEAEYIVKCGDADEEELNYENIEAISCVEVRDEEV